MDDVTFSAAHPGDLPAVRELLRGCGLMADDLQPEQLGHFVLCRAGEEIVGVVGLDLLGHVALLRSLAVASRLRHQRLGRELWTRAREHALGCGVRQLYLLTTNAEGLFDRWGFRRVSREHVPDVVKSTSQFSSSCPATAAVMTIDLTPAANDPDQRARP